MRTLILFTLMAVCGFSQTPSTYAAIKETALVAGTEKITVQQPGGRSSQANFEVADIYCSVACMVTFYANGTAATATTLAPINLNIGPVGTAVAFSASNAGTGQTLKSFYIGAGSTVSFDISKFVLLRNASGASNLSIGTNSITGTVRIQIQWTESQ